MLFELVGEVVVFEVLVVLIFFSGCLWRLILKECVFMGLLFEVVVGVYYDFVLMMCFVVYCVVLCIVFDLCELGVCLCWCFFDFICLMGWECGRLFCSEVCCKVEIVVVEFDVEVVYLLCLWMDFCFVLEVVLFFFEE